MKRRYAGLIVALAFLFAGCGGTEADDEVNGGTGVPGPATEGGEAGEGTESSGEAGEAGEGAESSGEEGSGEGAESAEEGAGEEAGGEEGGNTETAVDIRVDANRNGTIDMDDPTEDENEDTWSETSGAIFLANIDDDLEQCPQWGMDINLPKCKDSADEVINGELDLLDLARLKTAPMPEAEEGTVGTISVGAPGYNYVRLFVKEGEEFKYFNFLEQKLTTEQLRAGVELAIEGIDVVRSEQIWDGYITLTFGVADSGGTSLGLDVVKMRVSPMMLYHHLLDAEVAYVAAVSGQSSIDFRTDFQAGIDAAGNKTEYFEMAVETSGARTTLRQGTCRCRQKVEPNTQSA